MKYLFHPVEARSGVLFEDDANPDGWFTTPAVFGVITAPSREQLEEIPPEKAEVPAELTKDELLALAEQRGIDVDKRLGVEKLRAVLNGDRA